MAKEAQLSLVIRAVDQATAPLRAFNQRLSSLTDSVKPLGASLSALGKESGISRLGEGFSRVGGEIGNLKGQLLGAAAAIGVTAGAAAALFTGTVKGGDDLAKQADQVGLTVDKYAQFRFIFAKAGLSGDEFFGAMKQLAKGLGEAKAETGGLFEATEKLGGLAFQAQVKRTKDVESALYLLSRATEKLKDPTKRLALVNAFLGDAGGKAIGALKEGPSVLARSRVDYLRLAGSQEELARSSEKMADTITDAETAFAATKQQAVAVLYPAVGQLIERFTTFFVANRPAIVKWAEDFGKTLPDRVTRFVATMENAWGVVGKFVERIGGWGNLMIAVAAIISGKLIVSVLSLGVAIGGVAVKAVVLLGAALKGLLLTLATLSSAGLIGVAILGAKIIAIAAAVGLVAALVVKYWEPIKAFFLSLWESIKAAWQPFGEFFTGLWEIAKAVFSAGLEFLKGLFFKYHPVGIVIAQWEPIKGFFAGLWEGVKVAFAAFWAWMAAKADGPSGALRKAWEPLAPFFKVLWDGIVVIFDAAWVRIKPIVDKVLAAAGFIADKVGAVGRGITGAVDTVRNIGRAKQAGQDTSGLVADALGSQPRAGLGPLASVPSRPVKDETKIKVDFENMPKGVKVEKLTSDPEDEIDISTGYALAP